MRLIDADALKRLVDEEWFDCQEKSSFFNEIDRTPTIDHVKHGKWLKYPGDIVSDDGLWGETLYACSECGHIRHVATEFCSKCGAKMEQDGEIQVRWKSDLISRQAAIKALCENGMCGSKKCNAFPCEDVKAIEGVQTIDPVKHGRWKNKQMHDEELNEIQVFRHRCSECRFEICTTDETLWWNYCPNCGASMDGGEDDEPV